MTNKLNAIVVDGEYYTTLNILTYEKYIIDENEGTK